jgi:hypothetical protein
MLDIFVMLFFFLDAVFIHLIVCRKRSQEGLLLKPFIGIALTNLCLLWAAFWFSYKYVHSDPSSIWSVNLHGCATVIYILLIPTYLVFYFSTQQMSPSKKILLLLSDKGPLSFQELLKHFSDQEFVLPRIKELIGIRCLVEHGGWYVLTPSGAQMANVYKIYQSVLGRTKGG